MKRSEISPPLKWIIIGWITEAIVVVYIKICNLVTRGIISALKRTDGAHVYMKKRVERDYEKFYRDSCRLLKEEDKNKRL